MELIPLFPLSIVVFPGQHVPLHIFEDRYKEMIADCEAPPDGESSPFGISLATNEGRKMESIGCTVVVEGIGPKYPDGSFAIVGQGRRRYLTRETYGDRAYATARVEYFDDVEEEEAGASSSSSSSSSSASPPPVASLAYALLKTATMCASCHLGAHPSRASSCAST